MDKELPTEPERTKTPKAVTLEALRRVPLFNHSSADIIEAYTDAMRRVDEDPEAEVEPDGPLWRDDAANFETHVRDEAKDEPLLAAELFVHTLHVDDPNARLLTAYAADVLVGRAPHLTLDIFRRLLSDESEAVCARAAVFFLENAESFAYLDTEAELKPVLRLVAESFPEDTTTIWTAHRGSGDPQRSNS